MAVWYAVGCNAVGLAVPPNERSDFWGERSGEVAKGQQALSQPSPLSRGFWGDFLIEKTGKNLHKFNQNQALKSILK